MLINLRPSLSTVFLVVLFHMAAPAPAPQQVINLVPPKLPASVSPNDQTPAVSVHYEPLAGSAFGAPCRICPDDIQQGRIGDCFFLSALGAIAEVSPGTIEGAIHDASAQDTAGNEIYDVSLYRTVGGAETQFPVASAFPALDYSWLERAKLTGQQNGWASFNTNPMFAFAQPPGADRGPILTRLGYSGSLWSRVHGTRPLWPLLMEKAFASFVPGKQGYTNQYFQDGGVAYQAMEAISGHTGGFYSVRPTGTPTTLFSVSITDSPAVNDTGGNSIIAGLLRGDLKAAEPNLMVCASSAGARLPNCTPVCHESHTCQQPFVGGGVQLDPKNQSVHFQVVNVDGPRAQHVIATFDRNPYDCPDTKPCTINPPESPNGPLVIGFLVNRDSRLTGGELPLETPAEVSARLAYLSSHHKPVVVGTIKNSIISNIGLVPGHAYSLISYDSTTQMLRIRNPQGGGAELSLADFMKLFAEIDYSDLDAVPTQDCGCPS